MTYGLAKGDIAAMGGAELRPVRWCVSADWDGPAVGQRWHKARNLEAAERAAWKYVRERTYLIVKHRFRHVCLRNGGCALDFGNPMYVAVLVRSAEDGNA